jgi:hypothetical protein
MHANKDLVSHINAKNAGQFREKKNTVEKMADEDKVRVYTAELFYTGTWVMRVDDWQGHELATTLASVYFLSVNATPFFTRTTSPRCA